MTRWGNNRICDALPAAAATIQRLHPLLVSAVVSWCLGCVQSVFVCLAICHWLPSAADLLVGDVLASAGPPISALMLLPSTYVCVLVLIVNSLPTVPCFLFDWCFLLVLTVCFWVLNCFGSLLSSSCFVVESLSQVYLSFQTLHIYLL